MLDRIDRYESGRLAADDLDAAAVTPEDDEEDEEFLVNRRARSYHLSELDLTRWRKDLQQDKETLGAAWQQVEAITPERDGKLQEIKRAVRARVEKPTLDRNGNPNRKLLVFTTFKDTAEYLYEQLAGLAGELGVSMAMVSGDETHAGAGANDFNSIEIMGKVPLPGLVAVRAGGFSWAGRPSGVTTPVKTVLPPSDPDPS